MDYQKTFQSFNSGKLVYKGKVVALEKLSWNPHPAFNGVSFKHIVTSKETKGLFSYHLVKIEPNCKIGSHIHEMQLETHEVITGSGYALTPCQTVEIQGKTLEIQEKTLEIQGKTLETQGKMLGTQEDTCKDQVIEYTAGTLTVFEKMAPHEVTASDEGLYLFAKFIPALV